MVKSSLVLSTAVLLAGALSAQSRLDVSPVPGADGDVIARVQGAEPRASYVLTIGLADEAVVQSWGKVAVLTATSAQLNGVIPGEGDAYASWSVPAELRGASLLVQGIIIGSGGIELTNVASVRVAGEPATRPVTLRRMAPQRRVATRPAAQADLSAMSDVQQALEVSEVTLIDCDTREVDGHEGFSMEVVLGGEPVSLTLHPRSVRTPDFVLQVDGIPAAELGVTVPPSRTFRGSVEGYPASRVAASVQDGRVHATIHLGAGLAGDADDHVLWHVQPAASELAARGIAASPGLHAIYSSNGVVRPEGWSDIVLEGPEEDDAPQFFSVCPPDTFNVNELAFDADVQFFNQNGGSVENTMNDIENIVNSMNVIYERDTDVTHVITTILVRTMEEDPYSTSDAGDLLNQFRNHWRNNQQGISRDLAHLMTGKNLVGSTIGIAWLNVVCASLPNGLGYGLSQSRFSGNFNSRVSLTAHEIGHNFAAGHCNGNGDCHIMCSGLGGCNGLGGPGFGGPSSNTIRNDAINSGCLGCTGNRVSVAATFAATIDASPTDLFGLTNGVTPFSLDYTENEVITLTAPSLIENAVFGLDGLFKDWEVNGVPQNGNEVLTVTVSDDMDVNAVYSFSGTVNVSSTGADASFEAAPADVNGTSSGSGPLQLTYFAADSVTITAPASVNGQPFVRWTVNGAPQPVGQTSQVLSIPAGGVFNIVASYRKAAAADATGAPTATRSL